MTYWAINSVFLVLVATVAIIAWSLVARARRRGIAFRELGIALLVVLAMTAVFDNVMIGIGLVGYDPELISGAFIGIAPLEDFAYAVAAVILLPSLWVILGRRMPQRAHHVGDHDASADRHPHPDGDHTASGPA